MDSLKREKNVEYFFLHINIPLYLQICIEIELIFFIFFFAVLIGVIAAAVVLGGGLAIYFTVSQNDVSSGKISICMRYGYYAFTKYEYIYIF